MPDTTTCTTKFAASCAASQMNRPKPVDGKPSLLAVTSELPWPLNSGGHLRTFHLLRAIAGCYRVRLVTAVCEEQSAALEALREHGIGVCPAFVRPRTRLGEGLRALAAAARQEPYVLFRRHDRSAVRAMLRSQLQQERPDVVYFDHLDSLVFRSLAHSGPLVIDLHNVYSTLARREGQAQSRWWKRLYLAREARLLERMEKRAARTADLVFAVSEEERRYFAALEATRVALVPNGVDCATYETMPTGRPTGRPTILYIGAMSWNPNAKAAIFLVDQVLPLVRRRFPNARVQIIGRDPPAELQSCNGRPGVEVLGAVPDVKPFLTEAQLLAVPLEAAGGTRLKILESFAAGLPTVSTPIGCEGLQAVHAEHLWVAPRAGLAEGILEVLSAPNLATRLAEKARALVRASYDWSRVGNAACTALAEVERARGGNT
jgi:glycosyltransferase involved in cell wall biosynthesis